MDNHSLNNILLLSSLKEGRFDYSTSLKSDIQKFAEENIECSILLFEYVLYKILILKSKNNISLNSDIIIIPDYYLNNNENIIQNDINDYNNNLFLIPLYNSLANKWGLVILSDIFLYETKKEIMANIIISNKGSKNIENILNNAVTKINKNLKSEKAIKYKINFLDIKEMDNTSKFILNLISVLFEQNKDNIFEYINKIFSINKKEDIFKEIISKKNENEDFYQNLLKNYELEYKDFLKSKNEKTNINNDKKENNLNKNIDRNKGELQIIETKINKENNIKNGISDSKELIISNENENKNELQNENNISKEEKAEEKEDNDLDELAKNMVNDIMDFALYETKESKNDEDNKSNNKEETEFDEASKNLIDDIFGEAIKNEEEDEKDKKEKSQEDDLDEMAKNVVDDIFDIFNDDQKEDDKKEDDKKEEKNKKISKNFVDDIFDFNFKKKINKSENKKIDEITKNTIDDILDSVLKDMNSDKKKSKKKHSKKKHKGKDKRKMFRLKTLTIDQKIEIIEEEDKESSVSEIPKETENYKSQNINNKRKKNIINSCSYELKSPNIFSFNENFDNIQIKDSYYKNKKDTEIKTENKNEIKKEKIELKKLILKEDNKENIGNINYNKDEKIINTNININDIINNKENIKSIDAINKDDSEIKTDNKKEENMNKSEIDKKNIINNEIKDNNNNDNASISNNSVIENSISDINYNEVDISKLNKNNSNTNTNNSNNNNKNNKNNNIKYNERSKLNKNTNDHNNNNVNYNQISKFNKNIKINKNYSELSKINKNNNIINHNSVDLSKSKKSHIINYNEFGSSKINKSYNSKNYNEISLSNLNKSNNINHSEIDLPRLNNNIFNYSEEEDKLKLNKISNIHYIEIDLSKLNENNKMNKTEIDSSKCNKMDKINTYEFDLTKLKKHNNINSINIIMPKNEEKSIEPYDKKECSQNNKNSSPQDNNKHKKRRIIQSKIKPILKLNNTSSNSSNHIHLNSYTDQNIIIVNNTIQPHSTSKKKKIKKEIYLKTDPQDEKVPKDNRNSKKHNNQNKKEISKRIPCDTRTSNVNTKRRNIIKKNENNYNNKTIKISIKKDKINKPILKKSDNGSFDTIYIGGEKSIKNKNNSYHTYNPFNVVNKSNQNNNIKSYISHELDNSKHTNINKLTKLNIPSKKKFIIFSSTNTPREEVSKSIGLNKKMIFNKYATITEINKKTKIDKSQNNKNNLYKKINNNNNESSNLKRKVIRSEGNIKQRKILQKKQNVESYQNKLNNLNQKKDGYLNLNPKDNGCIIF